ncbi:unnamed protein product (mitochondrion) [Plasmodiophora brassicae]|uniref:TOG domain-containing protein n=1 Tax=Plasmodiophora brassicae TaxID=37360 RepID=A0A3P3Y3W4_PLABS|nr:unnamed protein product [Plasmodiophora brassicae]
MAAADDTTPGITEENGGEEGRPVAFTPIKHDDGWRRTTAWVAPPEYPPGFVPVDEDPAAIVPLGKRLISKQWKERTIAYTELGNQVSGATANDLHTLTEYIELLPKMAGDINACAKAKGLLTCQAFVDRVTIPGELAGTLAKTVVSDAFKGNPRMLSDATEIIMKLIERGHGNVVFDELLAGLENKLPKITTACVQSILTAVEEFGCKAVPVRAIDDRVPSMLNHLNETCRATAMKLCSAMYTYRGVEFRDAIGRMEIRSAQEKDLNALFDSITVKSHTPARTVRRADGSIPQPSGLSISAPNTDRSVLDIMVKLPSSWIDEMRSDKWKDRKAAIDTLVSITSSRGQMKWSHEVADVVDAVRTQLSDNNIMVAGQAIAAFSNLAAGLPSAQFLPLALPMFPQVIQALKEKKHMVIGPALSFLDTFTDKTLGHDLSPVLDDLVAGLGHKTPKVAADLLQWLSSALPKLAPSCIKKNFIAALGTAISNNLDHSAGDVRANALGALAALLAVSGESDPFFSRFLPEFESRDSTRCRKIRDLAVEIASSIPARDPAPRAGDSQTKRTPKRNSAPAVVEQRDTDDKGSDFAASSPTRGQGPKAMVFEIGTTPPKQPASRPMAFEIDATTPKKHASRPKLPKRLQRSPPLPALRSKPPVDETPALPPSSVPGEPSSSPAVESGNSGSSATSVHRTVNPVPVNDTALPALAFEEASALLAEKMTPEVVVQLSSKNWKERVAAMEFINSHIDEEGFGVTDLCQPLLYTINKTPGWKEVNFQVNALMFEMVAKLASVSTAFSTRLASPPLVALLNKLGDPKLNATALDCCLALCEALGPAAIVPMILSKSASVKNPKALQGVVTALRTILIDFGASTMALKGIVDASKTWLAHSSAGVRTETTSLLLEMYKQVGSPPMRSAILDGLKPALAKVIEADIDTITPGSGILTPTRFKRGTLPDSSSSKAKNSKGNSGFVLERADISSKITGKLLQQMDCDAWKERKAALDTVSSILEAAHHHIQPNAHLSELILPWVSASLHQDMFSVDFQKHVVAFDTISQAAPCAFASVRDLLLAWTSLRIAEDKTQVVVKALEFCSSTLSSCAGLDEYDANCIVPVLVEKLLGHNKAPLRTRARELLKLSADAWSPSLVGKFLFDGIMVSKNSRVKSSCMDELVALSVKNGGVDGVVPRKALQVVAEFVTSHDSSMRNAAISLLQRAYNDLGDSVFWSRLGSDLPDKVRKVMEKQFKRPPAAPQSPRIGRPKSSEGTSAVPAPTSLTSVARAADPPSKASIQHADDDDMFRLDLEEVGIAGTPRDTQGAAAERKAESSAPSDAVPTALRVPSTNRLQPHIFGDEPTSDDSAAVNKLINDLEFGLDMPIAKEVNKLVTLLLQQIRSAIGPRGNQRLLSPAIDALASILKAHGDCHDLALGVSIDTLQFFYEVVLSAMLDKRLEGPHSKSSIAMLNILVLKSLETTDRSRCFAALIRSLTDLWSHTVVVDRGLLCTLICRCVVKLIKTLDKTHERLKLQMLLGEVHDFLERHPQSFWEARSDQIGVQKPWNTVFTLVVKLVELRGASILHDIVGVPKGALLREIINERLPAASKAPSAPVQGNDDTSLRAPVIEGVHRLSLSDGRSPAVPDTKGAFSRSSDRADLEPYLANVESRIRARSEPAAAENASGAQGGSTTSRVLSYQERFRLLRSRTQGSSSSEPRLAAGSPTKSISSIPSTSAPPGVDTSLAMLRNRVNLAPPAAVTNDAKENGSGAPSNIARSAPAPPDHKPAAPSSLPPSTTTPSLSTLRARIEELKRKT